MPSTPFKGYGAAFGTVLSAVSAMQEHGWMRLEFPALNNHKLSTNVFKLRSSQINAITPTFKEH
jgi:hypothetical protein